MATQIAIEIDIKGGKQIAELQKQIRETKKALKETEDVEAYTKLNNELTALQAKLKQARKEQKQAVDAFTATDKSVGAYERLNAQLRVSRNQLKNLEAAGKGSSEEAKNLREQVEFLDKELKRIDKSVGQTNREVGNYEEAVRKALGETQKAQKVVNESAGAFDKLQGELKAAQQAYNNVAAAQGKGSEEAKKLNKEVQRLNKQVKGIQGAAQQGEKGVKSLRRELARGSAAGQTFINSFRSFGEVEIAIQTFQEIVEVLQDYFKATDAASVINRKFLEGIEDLTGQFVEEKGALDASFEALRNAEQGTDEYAAAIDNINEEYGKYLPNLLTEKSTLDEITAAQNRATEAIINRIAATRRANQEAELQQKLLEANERAFQAREAGLSNIADKFEQAAQRATEQLKELDNFEQRSIDALKRASESGVEFAKTNDEVQNEINEKAQEAGEKETERQKKEAEKRAQEREKARKKALEEEAKFFASRAKFIQKLESDVLKAQIAAIEETEEGLVQAEVKKFEARRAELQAQFKKIEDQAKELGLDTANAEKLTNDAIEAELQASLKRRSEIRQDFADKELARQKEVLQARLAENAKAIQETEQALEKELLVIRQKRAEGALNEREAVEEQFAARRKAIEEEIKKLQAQETAEIEIGIELPPEEKDKILLAKQQLNTQLAELDQQRLDAVKKAAREEGAIIGEGLQEGIGIALETFGTSLDIIKDISAAATEGRLNQLEQEKEQRAANIEALTSELKEASGLEKKFIEQRIKEEEKANLQLAAQQDKIRKDQAAANKAFALGQAAINGALAITNILATVPKVDFGVAQAILIALTAATTAAQIGIIAAQPLATGGIVGFDGGGRVNVAQNIATQPNGDNVLATLKRGEVVLNQGQQARLGGAKTFRSIGVPGFQTGGVADAPIGSPQISALKEGLTGANFNKRVIQLIDATNARIDRIQVNYTTETDDQIKRDEADRESINVTATL